MNGWAWFWIAIVLLFTSPLIFIGMIDYQNTQRAKDCMEAGGSYTQEAPALFSCELPVRE